MRAEFDLDLGARIGHQHDFALGAERRVEDRAERRHHDIARRQPDADAHALLQIGRRKPLAAHQPGQITGADKDERFRFHVLAPFRMRAPRANQHIVAGLKIALLTPDRLRRCGIGVLKRRTIESIKVKNTSTLYPITNAKAIGARPDFVLKSEKRLSIKPAAAAIITLRKGRAVPWGTQVLVSSRCRRSRRPNVTAPSAAKNIGKRHPATVSYRIPKSVLTSSA